VLTHLWMLPCYRISNVCLQCLKNYNKNTNEFLMSSCTILYNFFGKSLLDPQPTRVGTHHPQPMKMDFFYPLNFLKRDESPLEAVLKKHSKSQKNHKMKIQIVLDFKLVVLRSEHTMWNAFSTYFFVVTLDIYFSP
jgi:hypothetical protein